uniref:FP protein C-terminal domain-containing protein n=1 Tax=Rhodnius prolixus TaxID=13249 RepID=T1I4C1_RHOPR
MSLDKDNVSGVSGSGIDINNLILAKLDSLSTDIATVRKEQNALSADVKKIKTDFKKLAANLEKDLKVCKNKISFLIEENKLLRNEINNLSKEVLHCSQSVYQNYVKIDNVHINENDSLFDVLKHIGSLIDLELREDMIDYIYKRKFGNQNVSSIICKFVYTSLKNKFVIEAKKNKAKLKSGTGQNIYVNEYLSSFTYKLLKQARDLKVQGRLVSVWHRNGSILVKQGTNDKPKVIRNTQDLLFFTQSEIRQLPGNASDEEENGAYDSDISSVSNISKRKRKEKLQPTTASITDFLYKKPK